MKYAAMLLVCVAAACGPQCLYWRDITGKNRDHRARIADGNACHEDEAYYATGVEAQDAASRLYDCMKKRGWVESDRTCPANER
jgi:hypothetical protein